MTKRYTVQEILRLTMRDIYSLCKDPYTNIEVSDLNYDLKLIKKKSNKWGFNSFSIDRSASDGYYYLRLCRYRKVERTIYSTSFSDGDIQLTIGLDRDGKKMPRIYLSRVNSKMPLRTVGWDDIIGDLV